MESASAINALTSEAKKTTVTITKNVRTIDELTFYNMSSSEESMIPVFFLYYCVHT